MSGQTGYKKVSSDDIERITAYCRANSVQNGGPFEVYSDPESEGCVMVVVNSKSRGRAIAKICPVGSFYCNYLEPGIISVDEDPRHDVTEDRKRHVAAIKRVIDILLRQARPGVQIEFDGLPGLSGPG